MNQKHKTVSSTNYSKFSFRKNDSIGNPAAESDAAFLVNCFVDNEGDLGILRNCEDERGILVGRTGAGKTALLTMLLNKEERVISLDPHDLALGYISDSPVLTFFESLGIKMDVFYRALWRHVFVVEILKQLFDLSSEQDKADPWNVLKYRLQRKRAHLEGLEYLRQRGTQFWNTTEESIKDITIRTEKELKATVDIGLHQFIAMGAEGAMRLTTEQHGLMRQLGQEVVNRNQMSKLSALFDALDNELLVDQQKRFFIIVDKLDEDWVDNPTRYRLIRALIETLRDFNSKIRQAKVVVALRVDLFDRVLSATRDSGFQGDKYQALCLPIRWNRDNLVKVVDRRINQFIENRYASNQIIGHREILPPTIGVNQEKTIDYVLDRTLLQPRDIIMFFNILVELSAQNTSKNGLISQQIVQDAENRYSRDRLKSLIEEWSVHYPNLGLLTELLATRSSHFRLGEITSDELVNLSINIVEQTNPVVGDDYHIMCRYVEGKGKSDNEWLRSQIAWIWYRVGLIGLKTSPYLSVIWSGDLLERLSPKDINDSTKIHIHKAFDRSLGCKPC